jgi:hypothetical protein
MATRNWRSSLQCLRIGRERIPNSCYHEVFASILIIISHGFGADYNDLFPIGMEIVSALKLPVNCPFPNPLDSIRFSKWNCWC